MNKWMIFALVGAFAGCSAEFTDLRPEAEATNPNVTTTDMGASNNLDSPDMGSNNTGTDAGEQPDSGPTNVEPGEETLIAQGDFVNVDYQTTGSAQYWQLADGSYEVRLTMDFASQGVPGPALALSPRNPLGGSIDADELDIGALNMDSGAQSYALPGDPSAYAYAWIWCKPFGLDVAFAEMEFQ